MTSILMKPPPLFQTVYFLSIRIRHIFSSLCDTSNSLTQISVHTRLRVIAKSSTIKWTSRSGQVILPNSDKTECLKPTFICRRRYSGLPPKSPGFLPILALAVFLRPEIPYALALFLTLSIGGALGDGALRCFFNPADVIPSCSAGWGPGILFGSASTLV